MGLLPFNLAEDCCSSPTLAQQEWTQLKLKCFSTVGQTPTLSIQPSVQLDLESVVIYWWTSYNRTCHMAVSDNRWRHFYLGSGTTALWTCL